jgi:pimeloyl-ACP methyl ester carboxylesterase
MLVSGIAAAAAANATEPSPQTSPAPADYRKLNDVLSFLKKRNAAQYALRSDRAIDEASYIKIGGIEQWVTIRGWNRDNPVILFLHGGPGDVTNPWSFALFRPWEKHFTIVQWDQRGSGRTLAKNGNAIADTITAPTLVTDGLELSDYLRKHLGKQKIILVAHSFGTILGLKMIQAKPDLFYAYVGTGQASDSTRLQAVGYDELLKKAHRLNNQEAIDDLTRIGPPPWKDGKAERVEWRWSNQLEGADQFLMATIGYALVAPGTTIQDFTEVGDGEMLSAEHLIPEISSLRPKDLGQEFSVPIFIFQGANDCTSPTVLARGYFDSIKAPRKEFVTIPDAGHFAVFMKSDEFLRLLVDKVRPLAAGSESR